MPLTASRQAVDGESFLHRPLQAAHKAQVDALMRRAQQQCTKMGDEKLTVEHMVLALADNPR